ncbi:RNA methyltransferase [Longimicrobium sp.]|uniref:RNA methyltransferase n=1 Tax=Longimicrobium sp. TaxID=2029185 RepID=UPI003B3B858D
MSQTDEAGGMDQAAEDAADSAARAALEGIVVVLWQTQDYVNIAGTVRAMKNFGLSRLRLIEPVKYDPHRIEGIAHDTEDIVQRIETHDSLLSALGDCSYVVGMTARSRRAKRAVARPRSLAPELLSRGAEAVAGETGPVALLFGREDKGLSNEALDLCHRTCIIPTSQHASLNLAQAVLVMAYELWMEAQGRDQAFRPPRREAPPARIELLEKLFEDAESALWTVDFFKSRQAESVMRTLREVVRRADPDAREAGLLRAISIEVVKHARRTGSLPPEGDPRDFRHADPAQNPPKP